MTINLAVVLLQRVINQVNGLEIGARQKSIRNKEQKGENQKKKEKRKNIQNK